MRIISHHTAMIFLDSFHPQKPPHRTVFAEFVDLILSKQPSAFIGLRRKRVFVFLCRIYQEFARNLSPLYRQVHIQLKNTKNCFFLFFFFLKPFPTRFFILFPLQIAEQRNSTGRPWRGPCPRLGPEPPQPHWQAAPCRVCIRGTLRWGVPAGPWESSETVGRRRSLSMNGGEGDHGLPPVVPLPLGPKKPEGEGTGGGGISFCEGHQSFLRRLRRHNTGLIFWTQAWYSVQRKHCWLIRPTFPQPRFPSKDSPAVKKSPVPPPHPLPMPPWRGPVPSAALAAALCGEGREQPHTLRRFIFSKRIITATHFVRYMFLRSSKTIVVGGGSTSMVHENRLCCENTQFCCCLGKFVNNN